MTSKEFRDTQDPDRLPAAARFGRRCGGFHHAPGVRGAWIRWCADLGLADPVFGTAGSAGARKFFAWPVPRCLCAGSGSRTYSTTLPLRFDVASESWRPS